MLEKFLKYEHKKNLIDMEIQNVPVWQMVRVSIYSEIISKKENLGNVENNQIYTNYFRLLFSKLKHIKYFFRGNPFFKIKNQDLLVFDHPRKVKNKDLYEDIYVDDLLINSDYSYYIYEIPYNEKHYSPSKNEKHIKYLDLIEDWYQLKLIFNKIFKFVNLTEVETNNILDILKDLENIYSVELNKDQWIQKIINKIIYYKIYHKFYNRIISKVNPKAIIEVVSYMNSRFVLNSICKEKGIPTIELQHGIIYKKHIAYNFYSNQEVKTFPNYIFTFGKYWNAAANYPIIEEKLMPIGWNYLEKKAEEFKKNKVSNDKSHDTLLFISQGTIGKYLSRFAVELSEQIKNQNHKILYKLHPGEYDNWKEEYPHLKNSNIEVIDNNDHDMHYFFMKANIQIGVYSTAIFEGLAYGIKTYIVDFYGADNMKSLIDSNLATLVQKPEEVLDTYAVDIDSEIIKYIWHPFAQRNFNKNIDHVIKKNYSSNDFD